jgi:hypothetical protein
MSRLSCGCSEECCSHWIRQNILYNSNPDNALSPDDKLSVIGQGAAWAGSKVQNLLLHTKFIVERFYSILCRFTQKNDKSVWPGRYIY